MDVLTNADDFEKAHATLEHIAGLRDYTRIVLNPRIPSAQNLLKLLQAEQQADLPAEKISIRYGIPQHQSKKLRSYERVWSSGWRDGARDEGQHVVLVAYDSASPVGYLGMEISVVRERGTRDAYMFFSLPLIYVAPRYRNQGFGIDLSVAAGQVASDLMQAVYRAVRPNAVISCTVSADYESKGGEATAEMVHTSLCLRSEILGESGSRKSIVVETPELDAGY
jgi:GNAT superfamily N-acetyltransferase